MSSVSRLTVVPVILAGGSGTRLWPLSRSLHPKQYLCLGVGSGTGEAEQTLFQQAVRRAAAIADGSEIEVQPPCIVANEEHRFTVIEQLRDIGTEPARVLLEPFGRNTAPALQLAALEAAHAAGDGGDPILVVTPADHAIARGADFTAAIRTAVRAAASGGIVVLGIRPERPDTGYGYIRAGTEAGSRAGDTAAAGTLPVAAFVEKPDLATAERYVADGSYYWNGGIFVLRASVWRAALQRFRPEIAAASQTAFDKATTDGAFLRFDHDAFAAIPADSIDYAVMEPASRAGSGIAIRMVPLDAGWSDLGAWDAVWQVGVHDGDGNAVHGDALLRKTKNTLVHASSRLVGVIGVEDVTIVETADAVLVAHRSKSGEVKDLVTALAQSGRSEASTHRRVHRPWGWYECMDQGPRFQVKRILVKPGARLSLQMHHHRAEHWVVVSGTAEVTNGDSVTMLSENQSTYIPLGQRHRLANPGKLPLEIIEVQSGSYLGEDDIVRFEDSYGRR